MNTDVKEGCEGMCVSKCAGVVGVVFVSLHLGGDGKSSFNSTKVW